MANGKAKARTIVEERKVELLINSAIRRNSRIAEMWEGLKYWVALNPARGKRIPHTEYFIYVTRSWSPGGVPEIWACYSADASNVYIKEVKVNWT